MITNCIRMFKWYSLVLSIITFVLSAVVLLNVNVASAKTVYDNQSPMTDKELVSFIELLPRFRAWASSNNEVASPSITEGKADFVYSENAAAWVKSNGWEPRRFFSVMGRAAAALFIVAEGSEMPKTKPTDMPNVTNDELELVRRHLAELLNAGSDAPPINQ